MTNIEIYHEVMRLLREISEFNNNATTTLKCKRACDLCNRGTANERLKDDINKDKTERS